MAFAPGTRLGPYEIVGPLGAGGMGVVYRARDTRLDRDVAIRIAVTPDGASYAYNVVDRTGELYVIDGLK